MKVSILVFLVFCFLQAANFSKPISINSIHNNKRFEWIHLSATITKIDGITTIYIKDKTGTAKCTMRRIRASERKDIISQLTTGDSIQVIGTYHKGKLPRIDIQMLYKNKKLLFESNPNTDTSLNEKIIHNVDAYKEMCRKKSVGYFISASVLESIAAVFTIKSITYKYEGEESMFSWVGELVGSYNYFMISRPFATTAHSLFIAGGVNRRRIKRAPTLPYQQTPISLKFSFNPYEERIGLSLVGSF